MTRIIAENRPNLRGVNKQAMNAMGLHVRSSRDLHEDMDAYDRLPERVRQALQECAVKYNPLRALRISRLEGVKAALLDIQRVADKVLAAQGAKLS